MTKYFLLNSRKQFHFIRTLRQRTDQNTQLRSCMQINVPVLLSPQTGNLSHLIWLFNFRHSSAADISGEHHEHWPSEIGSEQLLGHDQSTVELINVVIDQWSKW